MVDLPLSTLCLSCGLCCDGSLFASARLTPVEAERLSRRGLPLFQRPDGVTVLSQPCGALEGRSCAVYNDRPSACRAYDCDLAAALRADELDLAEALAYVQQSHQLKSELESYLPPDSNGQRLPVRVAAIPSPSSELQSVVARWNELMDHRFRGRRGR